MTTVSKKFGGDLKLFSENKIKKMMLILGQKLMAKSLDVDDFEDLTNSLINTFGLEQETIECARLHLLKLSNSLIKVD